MSTKTIVVSLSMPDDATLADTLVELARWIAEVGAERASQHAAFLHESPF